MHLPVERPAAGLFQRLRISRISRPGFREIRDASSRSESGEAPFSLDFRRKGTDHLHAKGKLTTRDGGPSDSNALSIDSPALALFANPLCRGEPCGFRSRCSRSRRGKECPDSVFASGGSQAQTYQDFHGSQCSWPVFFPGRGSPSSGRRRRETLPPLEDDQPRAGLRTRPDRP